MKNFNKLIIVSILTFCLLPIITFGQTNTTQTNTSQSSIVPNCGTRENPECGFGDLLKLVENILKWIVMISVPVSALVFAYAGFQFMTTGIVDKRSQAKSTMTKVFIGFVFILSAWLIVNTLLDALLESSFRNEIRL